MSPGVGQLDVYAEGVLTSTVSTEAFVHLLSGANGTLVGIGLIPTKEDDEFGEMFGYIDRGQGLTPIDLSGLPLITSVFVEAPDKIWALVLDYPAEGSRLMFWDGEDGNPWTEELWAPSLMLSWMRTTIPMN